ncbi:hypothetical protein BDN70DRAFT_939454 [Pholiota conissans]|uniref:Uncharacterized protein n=1 Tax=Pholiota conissans TaxID=109636 RepID=A0A9P5YLD1_9AGAR|nr:hypothetical protein BDN70DRAFT_939454 [Pholiota conissans]
MTTYHSQQNNRYEKLFDDDELNHRKTILQLAQRREDQEHFRILHATFASVKTIFSDLDGLLEKKYAKQARERAVADPQPQSQPPTGATFPKARRTLPPPPISTTQVTVEHEFDASPTPTVTPTSPRSQDAQFLNSFPEFKPVMLSPKKKHPAKLCTETSITPAPPLDESDPF